MTSAHGTMLTNCSYIKQDALCTGFHSPLLRARPALKLRTLIKQNAATRSGVNGYKAQVNCQHGRQIARRSSPTLTPEVCAEEDTLKPVPAWQKLASFFLKSTAVVALALALTFGSVSSAEAARSGGRMGGSGFSAARSGGSSYSSGGSSRSYGGSMGGSSSRGYGGSTGNSTSNRQSGGLSTQSWSSNTTSSKPSATSPPATGYKHTNDSSTIFSSRPQFSNLFNFKQHRSSRSGSGGKAVPSSSSSSSGNETYSHNDNPSASSTGAYSKRPAYGSFLGPSLGFGGYGYGGGFGGPVVVQRSDGGSGLITILVVIAAIFVISQVAANFGGGDDVGSGEATVCKLQVGLLGSARGLQKDLEKIAGRADTNTPDGLHYVLQETVLSLLRNPDYCVYGDGGTKNPRGLDGAEDAFNEVVMQERGKFKEETLVNVGGRSRRSSMKSRGDGAMSELIVVTVIVAAEGGVKVPKITSREELTKALNKLGALRSEQILAVEVMWTPQDENDAYSRDELFLDYPTLNTL